MNKQDRLLKLKKDLQKEKDLGKKKKEWRLTPEQAEYVKSLGYRIEPYLYRIKTRQFEKIHLIKSVLIKDIHFACKRGKWMIIRPLNFKEQKILKDNNIRFTPVKFIIYLR